MGSTFSRVKTWVAEVLDYPALNAEFDNILNNLTPSGVDDYSTNATQMRTDTDAGESGSESLATSLAGEIERLRFAIREIKGSGVSYWYQSASTSITELASALGTSAFSNRISSGRTRTESSQPLFLVPNGAAATVALKGATTNFVHYIQSVQYTIAADVTLTSLTVAPSSNNTCLVNMAGLTGQYWTKRLGEHGTVITVDTMGSEISALIGKLAAFKTGSTEYFIARVDSATQLSNAMRGYMFNSADTPSPRVGLTDNDTITLLKLTWIFAQTGGTLTACYTNPTVSATAPTSPAFGDYWFDLANNQWKIYSLSSTWTNAGANLVGVCAQDTTNCVAARGFDFFKNHQDLNTMAVERVSNTQCRVPHIGAEVSIYGSVQQFRVDRLTWDITAHLDSGVSEGASTYYYLYVKENGTPVISDVFPYDREADLKGLYHPTQTWRCIGEVLNDGSQNFSSVVDYVRKIPTLQKFTSSSGTYVTPLRTKRLRVRMVGGGGGGGGSGQGAGPGAAGSAGGNTTFGTSLLVANGGAGGGAATSGNTSGGSASLGTGPVGIAIQGSAGGGIHYNGGGASFSSFGGGPGGCSPFGGAGAANQNGGNGGAAQANTGSGGAGGSLSTIPNTAYCGGGGNAGGYIDAIIDPLNTTLLAAYAYAVGAAGGGGAAGTNGANGGDGGSGIILVEEFYV